MASRCSAITQSGAACKAMPLAGSSFCWNHSPEHAEAQRRAGSKGGKRGGRGRPLSDVANVKQRLLSLADGVLDGSIDRSVGAVASQILNVYLRAVSVELNVKEQEELVSRLEELEEALERQKGQRWYGAYSVRHND
jgi:hypothetical protein